MNFIEKVEAHYRMEVQAAKKDVHELLLSQDMYNDLIKQDRDYVGGDHYMGLAYFWNHEYNDYLKPELCSVKKRVAVHDAFVKANLNLKEASPRHRKIIKEIVGK